MNFWRFADGIGSVDDTPLLHARMRQVIRWVDDKYHFNAALDHVMSYPVPFVDSSHIRVVLDSIYFYNDPTPDTSLYWSNGVGHNALLDQYVAANFPERNRAFNIHIAHADPADSLNYAGYSLSGSIESFYRFVPDMNLSDVHDYWFSTHWAHELGHSFDLKHTYNSTDQSCVRSNFDFLWDIFDTTVVCNTSPCIGALLIP
ncbi:MAG: hypothetical protein IPO90_10830 [Flavobacteriales bacterium]|nr:hypothetical protein [Flavobacteriales bacterium]